MTDDTKMRTIETSVGRKRSARAADERSERELLAEISAKLDRVIAVLAVQGKEKDQQIEALAAAGFDSAFIGRLVGITPGAVRMWFTRRRRTSSVSSTDVATGPEVEGASDV